MTSGEWNRIIEIMSGLWPRWTCTGEIGTELWRMLGGHTQEAVTAAVRRAYREDPDGYRPSIRRIRELMTGARRHATAEEHIARLIEEHQEHYASWAEWEYPGDAAIRRCIERTEATPLQRHTWRRAAAAMRAGLREIGDVGQTLGTDETAHQQLAADKARLWHNGQVNRTSPVRGGHLNSAQAELCGANEL